VRDFLLTLPPEAQVYVVEDLNRALDRWQDWIARVGNWDGSY
jgi:hypothetical protein